MLHKIPGFPPAKTIHQFKVWLLIAGLASFGLGSLSISIPTAHAVTATPKSASLLSYCRDQAKQAKNACDDENFAGSGRNLTTAVVNIATYHCTDETGDKEDACIDKKAKEYLRKAAAKDNSSSKAFKSALNKILEEAGGSKVHPSPNSSLGGRDDRSASGADEAIKKCDSDRCDFVGKYINPFIRLLTAAFGIIAVGSLIVGGIQYSASAGDPQKVTKAKTRIVNTIIAIVAYFFLYGFLQFLIPGGLFNR